MNFTIQEIETFQNAATAVYLRGHLLHECGLCRDIRCEVQDRTKGSFDSLRCSYDIMKSILTNNEYNNGLGPDGKMTKDRMAFLAFICTMEAKELHAMVTSVKD